MGATLRPWLAALSPLTRYGSLFLLSDESWALSMGAYERKESGSGFLIGSGVVLYTGWTGGTAIGATVGGLIETPVSWGLDFAFTALFAALLAGRYTGRRDLLPWLAAAGVAAGAAALLPGTWYILLGALAGTAVGVVGDAR
jgi:predicted branched-subunit amino acid permease